MTRSSRLFAVILLCLATPAIAQDDFIREQTRLLAEAESSLAADPADADATIWKGRRLGYLGRYDEAIAAFEDGERRHPADPRFARHIGHRFISLRRFADAETALARAAALAAAMPDEVEPDGLPNAAGVPTSTLKGNIWYHLGLARYLQGDFAGAARAYAGAAALAHNPDASAAARYWMALALLRSGEHPSAEEALAPVSADWTLVENEGYRDLALCLKGELDCEALLARAREGGGLDLATTAYGVSMARRIAGDDEGAVALLKELAGGDAGAAFGRIAAEQDLDRLR